MGEEAEDSYIDCCPICSYVWRKDDFIFNREIHVNSCLENVQTEVEEPIENRTKRPNLLNSSSSSSFVNNEIMLTNAEQIIQDSIEFDIVSSQKEQVETSTTTTQDFLANRLHGDTQIDNKTLNIVNSTNGSMFCPICSEDLSTLNSMNVKIRHIKNCAKQSDVSGPRDLESDEYPGALDELIREAERLDQEEVLVLPSFKTPSKELKEAKITNYFTISKENTKSKKLQLKEETSTSSAFKSKRHPNSCPYWKKIPGTKIVVDAFEYCSKELTAIYFLSHFHYDHYIGLSKHFDCGKIYCSLTTARLLMAQIRLPKKYIEIINLNEKYCLPDGTIVTALDANHAPGSCVFLFETTQKKLFLHTGDFRANDDLAKQIKLIQNFRPIQTIFLDTTYCNENYDFLPQQQVIRECSERVQKFLTGKRRVLVVIGSYTIGKEKIALACSNKISVTKEKMKILRCYEDFSMFELSCFTTEKSLCNFWMVPMHELEVKKLIQLKKKHSNRFDHVLAIRPTGWVKSFSERKETADITSLFVPYSEHSSFGELKRFVRFLNPKTVVPTVHQKGKTKEEMLRLLLY